MRNERDDTPPPSVSEEHERYAKWLARGTLAGFAAMATAFVAYVAGVLEPHVPLERLPSLWTQPASRYLDATGIASGWAWASLLHKGDVLNLLAVALLAGCSVLALAAVIPLYARQRERLMAGVCAIEIVVMALAASNLLAVH
jgi:hypothetical protein